MSLAVLHGTYGSLSWTPIETWGSDSLASSWTTQAWKSPPSGYTCMVGEATNNHDQITPGAGRDEGVSQHHSYISYGFDGNDRFASPRVGSQASVFLVGGQGRDELTGSVKAGNIPTSNHTTIVLTDSWRDDLITDFSRDKSSIAIANNIFHDHQKNYERLDPLTMQRFSAQYEPYFFDLDRKVVRKIMEDDAGLYDLYRASGDIVGILKTKTFERIGSLRVKTWAQGIHFAWVGSNFDYELHFDRDGDWETLADQTMLANVQTIKATPEPSLIFGIVETGQWERCSKRDNKRPIEIWGK